MLMLIQPYYKLLISKLCKLVNFQTDNLIIVPVQFNFNIIGSHGEEFFPLHALRNGIIDPRNITYLPWLVYYQIVQWGF